jgi:hypothetical protein
MENNAVEAAVTHGLPPLGPGNTTSAEDIAGAPYDDGPPGDSEVIWGPLNNPHYLEDNYTVEMGYTLIILPGSDIRFQPGTGLIVHGSLEADGGDVGISFTSNLTIKNPGDWNGIYFDGGFLNIMYNCILDYATDGVYVWNMGMIGGGIQESIIRDNTNYGVYLDFVMGGPMINNTDIFNCYYGVYSRSSSLMMNSNEIFDNTYGVYLGILPGFGPIGPSLWLNNITNNVLDGVRVVGEMPSINNNNITFNGQHGIFIEDDPMVIFSWAWIEGNRLENNSDTGILVDGIAITILNNTILNGTDGIYAIASADPWIEDNWIEKSGIGGSGISFENSVGNITTTTIKKGKHGIFSTGSSVNVSNSLIEDWGVNGIYARGGSSMLVENTTMFSSTGNSISIHEDSHVTYLNSTFDKQTTFCTPLSNLTIKWWVHVKVNESDGDPAQGAQVWLNNTFEENVISNTTDSGGWIYWVQVTEYVEGFGAVDYDTHIATAVNNSEFGSTFVDIDFYQIVYIDLGSISAYQIPLLPGWNMVSIPLNQTDTTLGKVLESVDGNYKAVQWFDTTDLGDPWKHNKVGKLFGNDLSNINHKMGMWILLDKSDTLLVNGDLLPTTDTQLYTGWNLVGYPSLKNRTIVDALSSIAGKYDAVYHFNASDSLDPWKSDVQGDLTEMRPGEGYWIHATEDCIWSLDGM